MCLVAGFPERFKDIDIEFKYSEKTLFIFRRSIFTFTDHAGGAFLGLFDFLVWLIGGRRRRPAFRPTRSTYRRRTVVVVERPRAAPPVRILRGRCWVIDGDTIIIDDVRLRLAGIDAPELDHPWGQKSKWALVQLCKGQIVTAHIKPELSYDRAVAECYLSDGRNLAAELVRAGLALDWPAFSGGKYQHLEPPDARRRLWRANARQNHDPNWNGVIENRQFHG